jgi:RNA polymerase sigma factor (sigma-70 family)
VEGHTLRQQPLAALRGPSPLLRLASDERLIELTRSGQQAAFEVLVARYNARLLAFCRHMLHSREDAEDVLQEVFAAAFNAIMADSREINARPWLYRIARNRSLNHMRRNTAIGVDSMDTHFADAGQSTSERAHKREEFRLLLDDIAHLPETQRSALVLREMDALSYEQIAEAMDTTVPSVKSLLVRARIGLAEAAEARKLTCDEVRLELGAAAEGISSLSAPFRRHVKDCERCRSFRSQLHANNRALAAIFPLGPLLLLKKTFLLKLGLAKFGAGSAGTAGASAGASAGGGAAIGSAAATGGGLGALAAGAVVVKAVAVAATVAIVAVGASKALAPHATQPPQANTAQAGSVAQTAHLTRPGSATAGLATRPALPVIHYRGFSLTRHQMPVLPLVLHPATAVAPATTTPATSSPATAPAGAPAPVIEPTTTTPTPTPTTQEISTTTSFPTTTGSTGSSSAATPTTQEVSTTTAFPGTTGSTGTSTTAATGAGATGGGAPIGGATGSTGGVGVGSSSSTGSTGSAAGAGATGSTGDSGPTFSQEQTGASGSTGAPGAS